MTTSNKRILVTGGAGYIGSVCVEALCDAEHDVLVIDNLSEGHRDAVDSRAKLIVTDLQDTEVLTSAMKQHGTEAVIHFAAFALVGESMQNPGKYFHNNLEGGMGLLDVMIESGVSKIVFSSTCATYGLPIKNPIDEETPQCPVNPYGESKLAFEKILQWFAQIHGIKPVIFRYFNAAGSGDRFGECHRVETHLIPNVLKVAMGQKEQVEVYGTDYDTPDGTAIRDYVHVKDLAEIHRIAVERNVAGAFNLGTGNGVSVNEVIKICEEVTGIKISTKSCPRREGDPPLLVASNEKLVNAYNWLPKRGIKHCVKDAWNWHKNYPNGYEQKNIYL